MGEIKYTRLRHELLAIIVRGGVERSRWCSRTWDIPDGSTARQGNQQRAVSDLVTGGAAQIVRGDGRSISGPVVVTARGAALLANWNEAKGPALAGGEGDPK